MFDTIFAHDIGAAAEPRSPEPPLSYRRLQMRPSHEEHGETVEPLGTDGRPSEDQA
jgi:hypothetical protein